MTTILSNLNRYTVFLLEDFLVNLQLNYTKDSTAPCVGYVATLPCERLMSAKQAIDDINYKVV